MSCLFHVVFFDKHRLMQTLWYGQSTHVYVMSYFYTCTLLDDSLLVPTSSHDEGLTLLLAIPLLHVHLNLYVFPHQLF